MRIVVPGSSPVVVLPPIPALIRPNLPKRVYIRREVEITKYGMTPNCPGCRAIAAGVRPQSHSEECRKRIEQCMRDDDEAARRLGAAAAKRARTEEPAVPALAAPAQMPGGSSSSSAAAAGPPVILGPGGGSGSGTPPATQRDGDEANRGLRRSADEAGMDIEYLA